MRAGKVLIQCNYCLLKVTIVSNWCQLQRMSVGNLTGQVLSTQFIEEGIEHFVYDDNPQPWALLWLITRWLVVCFSR